jgi:hypothetical protein
VEEHCREDNSRDEDRAENDEEDQAIGHLSPRGIPQRSGA